MTDPFDSHMQRVLARLCVEDLRVRSMVDWLVRDKHLGFTDASAQWVWRGVQTGQAITITQVVNEANRLPLNDPTHVGLQEVLAQQDPRDQDYVRANVVRFAQRQVYRLAFNEAADLWNKGDPDGSFELFLKRADEIKQIRIDTADRGWFFEELSQRMDGRSSESTANRIPTGIEEIDDCLGGGLRRRTMGAFVGYSGVGKSMALSDQAWGAARMRFNVLQIVLEGNRDYIEARHDARFMQITTAALERGDVERERFEWAQREYAILRHKLVVRGTGDSKQRWRIEHVFSEVEDLYHQHGWIPDLVVLDYGDLLVADGEDEVVRQKNAWEQIHKFSEYKISPHHPGWALWTASQAIRPTPGADEKEHLLFPRDMGESYGKVKPCELIISINRTAAEKEAEYARLLIGKNRHGSEGRVVRVQTNYGKGEFIKLGGSREIVKRLIKKVPPPLVQPQQLPPPTASAPPGAPASIFGKPPST